MCTFQKAIKNFEVKVDVQKGALTLVENYAKKNRSHFPIAVLWLACYAVAKCMHILFYFGLPTEILGIWVLVTYR